MAKKHMTSAEKSKREKIVKGMKKGDGEEFEKRYPGRGKEVMYATATKQAMEEDVVAYYKQKLVESLIQENEQPQKLPHPIAAHINSLGLSPELTQKAHDIISVYPSAYTYEQPNVLHTLHSHLLRSGLPRNHPVVVKLENEIHDLEHLNYEKAQSRAGL